MILKRWCQELDLKYLRVYGRIVDGGWSFEDAITKPKNYRQPKEFHERRTAHLQPRKRKQATQMD